MRSIQEGVLCGADKHQEWLLPWWWSRYTDHNSYPVAFCDFGMSPGARAWCKERGEVIDIACDTKWVVPVDHALMERIDITQNFYKKNLSKSKLYPDSVSRMRKAWFKKPFAFLETPFQKTVWIDLDCEILASLSFLFDLCQKEDFLGLVREPDRSHLPLFDSQILYNGGVIVYSQNLEKIRIWAQEAILLNGQFFADDHVLSHLISRNRWEVDEIPEVWNWRVSYGMNLNVQIVHWMGDGGKEIIKQVGGMKPYLDRFYSEMGQTRPNFKNSKGGVK
ncbi:MAG: hypothetical protein HYZ48_00085 [Chlamydiales bacterium]|nr:hypothetical protein [Chlamydiales bacterium]